MTARERRGEEAMSVMRELRELHTREVTEWSNGDLLGVLEMRYGPSTIPPCSVCRGKLSLEAVGGGEPHVWACSGLEDDPARPGGRRYAKGRKPADDHYVRSEYVDRRQGGDVVVVELLRRFRALDAPREAAALDL